MSDDQENRPTRDLAAQMRAMSEGTDQDPLPLARVRSQGGHVHGPDCGPGCGHNHGDGNHHHHEDEEVLPPQDTNNGLLRRFFSVSDVNPQRANTLRSTALLATSAGLPALASYMFNDPLVSASVTAASMAWVSYDASEELMETIGHIRDKLGINSVAMGMGLSAVHVGTEALLSIFAKANGYTDALMTTTMTSNVGHVALAVGLAGVVGSVATDEPHIRKMNIAGMLVTSGLFGYQIATGDTNPWLSGAGIATGGAFAWWRIRAGIACAAHGDSCSHASHANADTTDYISVGFVKDTAKSVQRIALGDQSLEEPEEIAKDINEIVKKREPLTKEQILTSLKVITPVLIPLGALTVGGHQLGVSAVEVTEILSANSVAMGSVIGLSALAPELFFSTAAARKGEKELAAAAIMGCAVMGTGIVGGLQGLMGYDISPALDLATTSGKVQMAALLTPVFAYAAITQDAVKTRLAKVDNAAKEWLENKGWIEKAGRTSNWLNNSGNKIAKLPAAGMLTAGLAFYGLNTLPLCHAHGERVHCYTDSNEATVDSTLPSLEDLARQLTPAPAR